MKRIWKFNVPEESIRSNIRMPKGAVVLTVQSQYEQPVIWALVDIDKEYEDRYFEVFRTGFDMNDNASIERVYIGTFQINNGNGVYHLFERLDMLPD